MAKNFGIDPFEIIGLLDLTAFGSAKYGYAFTDNDFLIHIEELHFKLKLKNIQDIKIYNNNSGFFSKSTKMKISLEDGRWVELVSDDSISKSIDMYNLKNALDSMKQEVV